MKRERSPERGSAIMELVVALPLLLVLVIGVINVGLGLNDHATRLNAVRSAVREVARWQPPAAASVSEHPKLLSDFAEVTIREVLKAADVRVSTDEAFDQTYAVSIRSRVTTRTPAGVSVPTNLSEQPISYVQIIVRLKNASSFSLIPRTLRNCVALTFRTESNVEPETRGDDEGC